MRYVSFPIFVASNLPEERGVSSHPSSLRIALVGAASLALAMGIGRFVYTPLLPMMRHDGLVTVPEAGVLASAHFLGYLMGALSAAWLTFSPRTLLRVSLITIAAATFAMGFDLGEGAWLALRWLAGLCSARVLILVGNHYVARLAALGSAGRQSWVFSGVGAGIAVAGLGALGLTLAGVGALAAWQAFGVAALVSAAALAWFMGAEPPAGKPVSATSVRARGAFDWTAISAYGAAGLGYIIPATYLPVMAREAVSDPLIFGSVWPVFGAAAFVSTLVAAPFHRRFSNRAVWSASQLVMALGVVLPVFTPHILALIAAGLSVGGTFMIVTMAGIREAHRIAPAGAAGTHIAAMTAAFAAGQMIGPGFAGLLYEFTGDFTAALGITAVVLMVTAGLLVVRPLRAKVAETSL